MARTTDELRQGRGQYFLPTAALYYKDPLQLVKAKGTRVWDAEGNEYLDAIGGIVSISAGHNHPKIKQALRDMLDNDQIQHTTYLYLNEHNQDLAEKLVERAPNGLSRCYFTNSGSEANELAIMAARHATGEQAVVSLRLGYHGGTAVPLAMCGHHTWRFKAQPVTGIITAAAPYCYRCPFSQQPDSCNLACAKDIEDAILTATHGKIAALIIEPIMGVGGFIDASKAYFQEAYRICKKYGGMYISDEVQTGVGRTGESFFAAQSLGIEPDIITMAKGFGNGAPIGAVIMRQEIAEPLRGKLHFNTFGGDPYQARQAAITLDIIKEENLIENAKVVGAALKEGFLALKAKYEILGDVRGRGLMYGLELVKDKASKAYNPEAANAFMEETKKRGLLVGKGGLFGNIVRLAPPMTLSRAEATDILRIIDETLHAISAS